MLLFSERLQHRGRYRGICQFESGPPEDFLENEMSEKSLEEIKSIVDSLQSTIDMLSRNTTWYSINHDEKVEALQQAIILLESIE